jgi:hypothetical protein
MKRCPVCGKIYGFEMLRFCRFDGVRLVDIASCEAPTILLNPHEVPDQTAPLPRDSPTGNLPIHQ